MRGFSNLQAAVVTVDLSIMAACAVIRLFWGRVGPR